MNQLGFFDAGGIEERFLRFHASNPHIYEMLVRFAREARRHGKSRFGVRVIWERMRFEMWLSTVADDDYKLNDHFTSRYARLIMDQEPDLAGIFETRRLRSA